MTAEEAIEILTSDEKLAEIEYYGGFEGKKKAAKLYSEAFDMAISALEKQIPEKPEYQADGYADGELVYDYAKCPICGHDFEYGINDWGCKCCSDCGQHIDWSEEE